MTNEIIPLLIFICAIGIGLFTGWPGKMFALVGIIAVMIGIGLIFKKWSNKL